MHRITIFTTFAYFISFTNGQAGWTCGPNLDIISTTSRGNMTKPTIFQPTNNQSCTFNIIVPNGSYVVLDITGNLVYPDKYYIVDSATIYNYMGNLILNNVTYYLPSGKNVLTLSTSSPLRRASTFAFTATYRKLPTTNAIYHSTDKNMKPVIIYSIASQMSHIITSKSSTLVLNILSNLNIASYTQYLIYDGSDITKAKPLGSLFFYAAGGISFPNGHKQITIVKLDGSVFKYPSDNTAVVINDYTNLRQFNNNYGIQNLYTYSWTYQLNASKDSPSALLLFSGSAQTQYITNMTFSSNYARLTVEAGGPTVDRVYALATYNASTPSSVFPQLHQSQLRTYIAENGSVNITFQSYVASNQAPFSLPTIGRSGFLTSSNYPFENLAMTDWYFFSDTDHPENEFNFVVKSQQIYFNGNISKVGNGTRRLSCSVYNTNDKYYLISYKVFNTTDPSPKVLMSATGNELLISFSENPGADSGYFITYQFDKPNSETKFSCGPLFAFIIAISAWISQ